MKALAAFLLVVFSNVFFIQPTYAGFIDGNALLGDLEAKNSDSLGYQSGLYDGYITGIADLSMYILWCPPDGITGGQIQKIVAKYLKSHPEMLHKNADSLVINGLKKPFPCKK